MYALCMKYEFNISNNQMPTFNEFFRRENCNELGQQLNEDAANVIIMEFRKFMFLVGCELARIRRTSGLESLNPLIFKDKEKVVACECPYSAPPYIDRVWRAIIAYERKYKYFCFKVCFGYLLRNDPRETRIISYKMYKACRED